MSISSIHYHKFYQETLKNSKVWTIKDKKGFPAPLNKDGSRSMPFWSSKERVINLIGKADAYSKFEIFEMTLDDFLKNWVPGLIKDNLQIGINWSGKKATGYDINPKLLKNNLEILINEKK
ncbi:DUF2750 domain-containing protein [Leptospira kanakyensis]|uniref:DUF2750 domain-containing protein n=1 Tax=Leptospira kanakyensis TaxID=2484968 RepID=UPI00223DC84B|nr:DUF2750 domain-containing protein [Leptospira kanakyensis]MCW7471847.1 DUF2750 domain-containing protein [Leptospira kanakyensis]